MDKFTDLIIYEKVITWEQAVNRTIFLCSEEKITEVENNVKDTLITWSLANDIKFVDIEFVADLLCSKNKQLDIYNKISEVKELMKCDCKKSELDYKPSLDFVEIEDDSIRWLLYDNFYKSNLEEFNSPSYYGKFLFYFSHSLMNINSREQNEDLNKLKSTAARFWISSARKYGAPSIGVCTNNLINMTEIYPDLGFRIYPETILVKLK